ncbi:MAG: HAMP domain-containing sensor histidine kinase [Jaaginema sp. PMC 1079.18]|nr:HAMP domain-containing sensor histidine kinase [Jaaginema sp. PMC 1080.18]MEC4853836.1 HAMP domain-containing sensor histidine kinase [Jaaginema sp. PMC 1079.18]MEC4867401.1 HAMP domain-containing sensor histidine kinase [Jaaginema sp. PMC 1078.18]
MLKSNPILLTINDILKQHEEAETAPLPMCESFPNNASVVRSQREWYGAVAAVDCLLARLSQNSSPDCLGLVLSSPTPVISDPTLGKQYHLGVFTPTSLDACQQRQLPGAANPQERSQPQIEEYPLLSVDPLTNEQFCLIWTQNLAMVMVFNAEDSDRAAFRFSFDPQVIEPAWQSLRSRLALTSPQHLRSLDAIIAKTPLNPPDYRLVSEFSRLILKNLPELPATLPRRVTTVGSNGDRPHEDLMSLPELTAEANESLPEYEFLQALTHEIRTPLTTIRMLVRLLLKKRDNLNADAVKRLEAIDQECTAQINRMELIFRAAELENAPPQQQNLQLIPISLSQVIQERIPHWQKQAQRRNVNLDIVLPEKLPTVVSNPAMLDQALAGLMESFTRSLPTGGRMRIQVTTAGHQLKLQLMSPGAALTHSLKAMGQLLMFQPETGNLSLNLDVTKNLFHALGGKLIVRQRPQQGEELTIFLPLGNVTSDYRTHPFVPKSKSKVAG